MGSKETKDRADGQPGRETVSDAITDYLVHLKALGRKRTTIDAYAHALRRLDSALEAPDLRSLSADALDRAVASLAAAENMPGTRLAETTLNRFRSTFRGFCRWSFETGRTRANPSVLLRRARVASRATRPLARDEMDRFLRTIRESGDARSVRDEALFSACAWASDRPLTPRPGSLRYGLSCNPG